MLSLRSLAFILCSAIRRARALSCASFPDIIIERKGRKTATNTAKKFAIADPMCSLPRYGLLRTEYTSRREPLAIKFFRRRCRMSRSLACTLSELLSKCGDYFSRWRPVRVTCIAVEHQCTGFQDCFVRKFNRLVVIVWTGDRALSLPLFFHQCSQFLMVARAIHAGAKEMSGGSRALQPDRKSKRLLSPTGSFDRERWWAAAERSLISQTAPGHSRIIDRAYRRNLVAASKKALSANALLS